MSEFRFSAHTGRAAPRSVFLMHTTALDRLRLNASIDGAYSRHQRRLISHILFQASGKIGGIGVIVARLDHACRKLGISLAMRYNFASIGKSLLHARRQPFWSPEPTKARRSNRESLLFHSWRVERSRIAPLRKDADDSEPAANS